MEKDIIFVINRLNGGGAERVICILANSFCEKGYQVTICSFSEICDNYKINPLVKLKYIDVSSRFNVLKKIRRIFKLRIILMKKRCTVIAFEYFVNMQTIIASIFLKNKIIISERNDPQNEGMHLNWLRCMLYSISDILICQTQDAKEFFSKKIQNKTVIIPNPVSQDLPLPYKGIREKEIVTFCRIERQKNLNLMIDAFEMLVNDYPEYSLVIYGDGSCKAEIELYIEEKNLSDKIKLYGFTHDVHEKILKATMYINSSDYEGMSNSMLEAMAIGLPVVVTNCPSGGAKSVIENGQNGILVSVGDTYNLYKAMKQLIENPRLANYISNNELRIREELSPEKICALWENAIKGENINAG